MTASKRGEVSPSFATSSEKASIDDSVVQLLIPEKEVPEESVEQVIEELSEAFDGYIAFSTECTWLNRQSNLQSEEAVVVEVMISEPLPENQTR